MFVLSQTQRARRSHLYSPHSGNPEHFLGLFPRGPSISSFISRIHLEEEPSSLPHHDTQMLQDKRTDPYVPKIAWYPTIFVILFKDRRMILFLWKGRKLLFAWFSKWWTWKSLIASIPTALAFPCSSQTLSWRQGRTERTVTCRNWQRKHKLVLDQAGYPSLCWNWDCCCATAR